MQPRGEATLGRIVERGCAGPRAAASAGSTTEIPGVSRADPAASVTRAETVARRSADRTSARTAAPSTGAGPIWTTESPGRSPPVGTVRSLAIPSICPTTSGWRTARVTSVCPPTSTAPTRSSACRIPAKSASASSRVEPSGSSTHARNHRGRAPVTATSFALTSTACAPTPAPVRVMGSVATTSVPASNSIAHASSPMRGPSRTSGGSDVSMSRARKSGASLPAGSDADVSTGGVGISSSGTPAGSRCGFVGRLLTRPWYRANGDSRATAAEHRRQADRESERTVTASGR